MYFNCTVWRCTASWRADLNRTCSGWNVLLCQAQMLQNKNCGLLSTRCTWTLSVGQEIHWRSCCLHFLIIYLSESIWQIKHLQKRNSEILVCALPKNINRYTSDFVHMPLNQLCGIHFFPFLCTPALIFHYIKIKMLIYNKIKVHKSSKRLKNLKIFVRLLVSILWSALSVTISTLWTL